ncbi:LacI family DNA-binding transcriptional regulator [Virgibacillus halodenitrificans]|uniref:LacI family transcriptional regulator n=1 Tax=Virgibacillus halodenitrificans TaxID=1482 RepID=A0AAC9NM14_VIRHA|nr:LacI family DNA-binding transcriptional regulator [Virgibacillus halodenitrificans]APC49553.1 LacI family transcriptional regulator [Virgibacillus halodenitrificans]MCG1027139.1 LacI family DNA-binding transcriptional regulator [Virgibacillus halodenitrificans]MEC2159675.1 LacI family DNA-binding transcriptional regulator [Virgibacillus halodenitrificans]CDQ31296.1 Maltose operon transcriptional repressor [Virgibacillus halodenitrificans]
MAVTIKDVAKKANVSPSTVSRVISNSPRISENTKRKVHQVMKELGYHLNYNAHVLAQQKTRTIGIVMKKSASDSLHDPFFPEVLRGISAYCNKEDYNITLTTGESEEEIYENVVKMVRGKRVDGMIVTYSKRGDKVIPYLIESKVPFVLVGRPNDYADKIMFVDNDNVKSAEEATDYLIGLGHQTVGYIGGDLEYEVSNDRLKGYQHALTKNKLPLKEEYVANSDINSELDDILSRFMNLNRPPTALVVTDDLVAMKVLQICRKEGIDVPEELSIISFNNALIAQLSSPALTSVDTQVFLLGHEAAKCVVQEIKETSAYKKSIIIPTVIKRRESCQPLQEPPKN